MSQPWYSKGEYGTNAQRVREFYQQVLHQFILKLQRECRYKGFINEEQMQQMELKVKEKLARPEILMRKCLDMKEGSRAESEIKNQPTPPPRDLPELKEQYIDDKDEYLMGADLRGKQEGAPVDDQEEVDDLEEFQIALGKQEQMQLMFKPMKSEAEVKKEDNSQEYKIQRQGSEKEIKNQQESEEQQVQELTVQQCLQSLNSIVLATFSAQTLRHKPKQQKITVTLDNSFLKTPYNEIYLGNISIDITKMEKSDIRKEFPSSKYRRR